MHFKLSWILNLGLTRFHVQIIGRPRQQRVGKDRYSQVPEREGAMMSSQEAGSSLESQPASGQHTNSTGRTSGHVSLVWSLGGD